MMNLYAYGEEYTCFKARKGKDFIYLENEQGNEIARFEGITDFSEYQLKDGDWDLPKPSVSDEINNLKSELIIAQQTITDQDLAIISAEQVITDNDLRILVLEGKVL